DPDEVTSLWVERGRLRINRHDTGLNCPRSPLGERRAVGHQLVLRFDRLFRLRFRLCYSSRLCKLRLDPGSNGPEALATEKTEQYFRIGLPSVEIVERFLHRYVVVEPDEFAGDPGLLGKGQKVFTTFVLLDFPGPGEERLE